LIGNNAPVSNAGTAQSTIAGKSFKLDGSASSDADGDALTYKWTLANKPATSTATLASPTDAKPEFTADRAGEYVFSLVVNDGKADSEPAMVKVNVGAAAFDTIPATLPPGVPAYGFESGSLSDIGDLVVLDSTAPRGLRGMEVVLVSWACETGGWEDSCVTTPGTAFTHPVTVRIRNAAGDVLAQATKTVTIPYRPTTDSRCAPTYKAWPTDWLDPTDNKCYGGRALTISFDLSDLNVTLTDPTVRYEVAFDTSSYGSKPLLVTGPYDSLNVGAYQTQVVPTVGTDVDVTRYYENGMPTAAGGWSVMAKIITGVPQH
jgi:PKD domain